MTNTNTTLAELREINIKKQREGREDADRENHIQSNMTSNTEIQPESHNAAKKTIKTERQKQGNTEIQTADLPAIQKSSLPVSNPHGLTTSVPDDRPDGNLEGLSVRDRLLLEAARQAAPKVVMKTVTIKMKPDLDDRLEAHCYELRKKKQDVIEDALLLYFETIEAIR